MGRKSLLGWIIVYKLIYSQHIFIRFGEIFLFFDTLFHLLRGMMALFGVRITNQLLMHQKSMQITCGRTDEYETWCLILTRRDECPSWLLLTESLFIWNLDGVLRTLPWRTYSWGDEAVSFHPLIFRYQIANSMLILFKAFCIEVCSRVSTGHWIWKLSDLFGLMNNT